MAFQLHQLLIVHPLQFILKKLGYVKLSEVAKPDQVLPPYSFMFRSYQGPPPCTCAQGSTELPLPRRIRMGSAPSHGLDYNDGDTQIMEAPSVQAMPSFMGLKRGQ